MKKYPDMNLKRFPGIDKAFDECYFNNKSFVYIGSCKDEAPYYYQRLLDYIGDFLSDDLLPEYVFNKIESASKSSDVYVVTFQNGIFFSYINPTYCEDFNKIPFEFANVFFYDPFFEVYTTSLPKEVDEFINHIGKMSKGIEDTGMSTEELLSNDRDRKT